DGDRGRTTLIARRVVCLTCQGGCGRSADHCPYSKPGARSLRALFNDLAALADNVQEWRCSAFLDLVAPEDVIHALEFPPLFAARNQIAHEGALNADKRTMSHLLWVTDRALNVGWVGSRTTRTRVGQTLIAHEGALNADKRTMSHLLWVTDRALNVGWVGSRTTRTRVGQTLIANLPP